MRIFFITSKLNFSTAGGSVEELDLMIRTLIKWGNEATVITVFSDSNKFSPSLPYRVISEHVKGRGLLGIQWGIYRLLRKYEEQAEVFHIDGHLFLYGAGLYRRCGGQVPILAFFNRELSSWPENQSPFFFHPKKSTFKRWKEKIRWYIEKYLGLPIANGIDWWATISPQFQDKYEEFGLKKDKETKVIGDPIDLLKIRSAQGITHDTYTRRNKRTGPYTIFYSSRMASAKGFDVLLTAFSRVRNKDDFRLILGGSGPEEKYVKQMVSDYRLEPLVTLPGWVDKEQLFRYYNEADIFIQADWMFFGTSISLLYGLAFCLPCIIPAGTGMHWVARDAALTFRYRDPDDLARAIEHLGGNYDLRSELSLAAYRRLYDEDMQFEKQIGDLWERVRGVNGGRVSRHPR